MRLGALAIALLGARLAWAQPEPDPGAEPTLIEPTGAAPPPAPVAAPKPGGFSHHKQIMASVRTGLGLRAIATYDETTYCGDVDQAAFARVCTGRAPFAIDFEVGYGVARKIDAFLELRVGIEADFGTTQLLDDGPHVFHMSPGARFFFSEGAKTKIFTTAQLVIDFAGYQDSIGGELGTDLGVRNMSGLWVDLDRAYGFYVYVGETLSFARWLRFELEGGIGFQGRYR